MLDKQVGIYTVGEEIGRGSFAVVSKGHHMVTAPQPNIPQDFHQGANLLFVA